MNRQYRRSNICLRIMLLFSLFVPLLTSLAALIYPLPVYAAGNTVTLDTVTAGPGASGSFAIMLDNSDVVASGQVRFTYAAALGLTITGVQVTSRTANFMRTGSAYSTGNASLTGYQVLFYNLSNLTIVPGTGAILTISYTTAANASGNTPLSFTQAILAGTAAQSFPVTSVNGTFTITAPTATVTATTMPSTTPTATILPTATSTATGTSTATATSTPLPTATAMPTKTPTKTSTATTIPSSTATATRTPLPPATTTTAPTLTPTKTATATTAPSSTATATITPLPTATAMPTTTPTKTSTATTIPSSTATVTSTPLPPATTTTTPTLTPTKTATATTVPSATATATSTPLPISTATATATSTPLPTATATGTSIPLNTATATNLPPSTATATSTATGTPTVTATATPLPTETPTATATNIPTSTPLPTNNLIYVSSSRNGRVDGLEYRDEDILLYNRLTNRWQLFFDGSDVGVANADLDAFDLLADGSILMSFDKRMRFPAFGLVDDSDLVRFVPSQLGSETTGTFAFFFDGSAVDLTKDGEDIDAVNYTSDGQLLISVYGSAKVGEIHGQDEDLLRFMPTALGSTTAGSWALYFDGSVVGLTKGDEDLAAATFDGAGNLYLATKDNFAVSSLNSIQGDNDDLFGCTLAATGEDVTTCTFFPFFNGDRNRFNRPIDGVSLGNGNPLAMSDARSGPTQTDGEQFEVLPDDPVTDDAEFDSYDEIQVDETPLEDVELYLPLINR